VNDIGKYELLDLIDLEYFKSKIKEMFWLFSKIRRKLQRELI